MILVLIALRLACTTARECAGSAALAGDAKWMSHARGLKLAQEIMSQDALKPFVRAERLPGPEVKSDQDYFEYACAHSKTDHHPAGTCRMGEDDRAVVDSQLRFNGIAGLRVIDASIMPTLVSSNTNATAIMIGEKGADMVRASHGI